MKPPFVSRSSDPDMQAVPVALMRAAQRARELARQTGTKLVVVLDGKLMELDPDTCDLEDEGSDESPTPES